MYQGNDFSVGTLKYISVLLPDVDRRLKKRVLKARSVEEYTGAVQNLWHSLEENR